MMTGKEYCKQLSRVMIDGSMVKRIETIYGVELPELIKKIISCGSETVFLEDDHRILSLDEIADAEKNLHVAFKENGIIPVADCGENDFIVYHFNDKFWSMLNIVDGTVFKKKEQFEELLK